MTMRACFLGCLLALVPLPGLASDPAFDWPQIETIHRPGAYWWWPGSAVDRKNLTANLETMDAAGIGGATIVPIYGAKGYEHRYIRYLTPEWLEMLQHTIEEADRLGMWVDMTTGTGWPFGGPMIDEATQDLKGRFRDGEWVLEYSGRDVKRAAPGGEGKTLNPFSTDALKSYLASFDQAFSEAGKLKLPRAQYHDSFEYKGDWSHDLFGEFAVRRGYRLESYLNLLFSDEDGEDARRVKGDYRETLSELHLEYIRAWVEWAGKWGCTTRNQAHGAPGNLLDLYAAAGIPETETFGASSFAIPGVRQDPRWISGMGPPRPIINRMASSAAHVTGKPLVAAESLTWLRNHFRASLAQAKPEIDQLFLAGINHVFIHGTCFSPEDVPWPGWLFYASFQYNPRNSIWRDAIGLNTYISRCQSILQSGRHDNDVAVYWPVYDIWQGEGRKRITLSVHEAEWMTASEAGAIGDMLETAGFGYDFISDEQLRKGWAEPYQAVVVPRTTHLPLETLEALIARRDRGQAVVFVDELPTTVPGYHNWKQREKRLRGVLQDAGLEAVEVDQLPALLKQIGAKQEEMLRSGLRSIRRRHEEGYHYFIANLGATAVDEWVGLAAGFRTAVIMDPQSGRTGLAMRRGEAELYLQLLPGETRIIRTLDEAELQGRSWPVLRPVGEAAPIAGNWRVEFIEGGPVLPGSYRPDGGLRSWTEADDPEASRFAGTARYTVEVELPDRLGDSWILDLGDVRESARVRINGQDAGILFSIPFRMEVREWLRPGTNRFEIEVTNLAANRIRDLDRRGVEWKVFHDINFVDHRYEPFDASGWEVVPSGLLGPVTLQEQVPFDPE